MNPSSGAFENRLLTIGQAAELLGVHPLTVRNWSEKGTIRCLRTPGGHRRYRSEDLERVLAAPQDDPATATAVVELVRGAVREALAQEPRPAASPALSGGAVLRGLRAGLSRNQRRSLTHLGRELLGLLIRYAVPAGNSAGGDLAAGSAPAPEDLLRRARGVGGSYGQAARRLGLSPAGVVATFNFFQETVVQALVECDALDYSRLNRLFGVALLAAVTAVEPAPVATTREGCHSLTCD